MTMLMTLTAKPREFHRRQPASWSVGGAWRAAYSNWRSWRTTSRPQQRQGRDAGVGRLRTAYIRASVRTGECCCGDLGIAGSATDDSTGHASEDAGGDDEEARRRQGGGAAWVRQGRNDKCGHDCPEGGQLHTAHVSEDGGAKHPVALQLAQGRALGDSWRRGTCRLGRGGAVASAGFFSRPEVAVPR